MSALKHLLKLTRGFWVLGRAGAGLPSLLRQALPAPLRLLLPKRHRISAKNPAPLARAFSKLGPTYIKLGQFLAVRRDILDPRYVKDLSQLHDKLPPFPQKQAEKIIATTLPAASFVSFSQPAAAASIAQVHKARTQDGKTLAVKILRPNIQEQFNADMESLFWAADKLESYLPQVLRLRPRAALESLQATTNREMDLRLEAASMVEIGDRAKNLKGIYIPKPLWHLTEQNILTMEWIEGIPINALDELRKAGHDLPALAKNLMEFFLTTALYDGFFHADLHPGNLFVRADGFIVPIDFGIVGRLKTRDRQAMAWILRGLTSGNYDLAARWHILAGYVPPKTDIGLFSQALRAIGEPILDKSAQDISVADLLWKLFETAGRFEMETQPQLLLLQKTMVAAEGIARTLDPQLNIWDITAPLVERWMRHEYSPNKIAPRLLELAQVFWHLAPELLERFAERQATHKQEQPENKPKKQKRLIPLLIGILLGGGLGLGAAILLIKNYPNSLFFV